MEGIKEDSWAKVFHQDEVRVYRKVEVIQKLWKADYQNDIGSR